MLKKILLTMVFGIAATALIIGGLEFVWPLIDKSGVIESGQYRGLRIGDSKEEIILKTTAPHYHSKLKIVSYRGPDGGTIPVFRVDSPYQLRDSNTWYLLYPSVHKEILTLSFQDGQLHTIHYKRDILSP